MIISRSNLPPDSFAREINFNDSRRNMYHCTGRVDGGLHDVSIDPINPRGKPANWRSDAHAACITDAVTRKRHITCIPSHKVKQFGFESECVRARKHRAMKSRIARASHARAFHRDRRSGKLMSACGQRDFRRNHFPKIAFAITGVYGRERIRITRVQMFSQYSRIESTFVAKFEIVR